MVGLGNDYSVIILGGTAKGFPPKQEHLSDKQVPNFDSRLRFF